MQKITGIGGIFFRAKDPEGLGRWYEENFGIDSMESGEVWKQEAGPTVFSPFPADTDYFGRPDQQAMFNFRVADIDAMLAQLEANGVRIAEDRMDESYGRFAWVFDPEDNRIELWQPIDSE
ncbi:MAG: VOC family protein [Fimbriimonas sp.]